MIEILFILIVLLSAYWTCYKQDKHICGLREDYAVIQGQAEKAAADRDSLRKCYDSASDRLIKAGKARDEAERALEDLKRSSKEQAAEQYEAHLAYQKEFRKGSDAAIAHWKRLAQFRDIIPDGSIEPPAWTVEDDIAICKMLRGSEVGIKVMQGLCIMASHAERQATTCAPAHREHACGSAAGWRACIGYLQTLSGKALPAPKDQPDETPHGDEDVSKLYAP